MKTIKITYLALVLILSTLVSCKKDEPTPVPTIPVDGIWIGHYTTIGDPTEYYLSFELKNDGVPGNGIVNVFDAQGNATKVGTGNYTLTDNILDIVFTYSGNPTQLIYTAFYDSKDGTINNATWGIKPSKTNGGTWMMTKQ